MSNVINKTLFRVLLVGTLCSSIFSVFIIAVFSVVNHDMGWLLFSTKEWLNGATLYTDIVEVNPPLIFLLLAPVVWLQEHIGVSMILVARIYFIIMTCAIIVVMAYLLSRIKYLSNDLGVVVVGVFVLLLVLPSFDVGQRDHLAIIFLLPYLFSRFVDITDVSTSEVSANRTSFSTVFSWVVLGGLGGLAVCLKPQYVVLPILCECWCLLKTRDWRKSMTPQFVGALLVVSPFLIYLLLTSNYITEMLPLASATYWTYGRPLGEWHVEIMLAVVMIAGYFGNKLQDVARDLSLYLSLLSVGALFTFVVQAHYHYHLIPFITLCGLNWLVLAISYRQRALKVGGWVNAVFVLFAVAIILSGLATYSAYADRISRLTEVRRMPNFEELEQPYLQKTVDQLNKHFSGESIYAFMPNVLGSAVVGLYTDVKWASGFPALWPLQAIDMVDRYPDSVDGKKREAIEKVRPIAIGLIRDKFLAARPAAVIIESSRDIEYFAEDFSYLDFLNRTPELESLLSDYAVSEIPISFFPNKQYQLYVRKDFDLSAVN